MTKGLEKQPDEKVYRVRSRKVLSARASLPMVLGWRMAPSQHRDVFTSPEAFQVLYFRGFYGGFIM